MDDLSARARRVIDTNLYLVLATANGDGEPLASPLFYAADGYRELYWASSPDVEHSANLAANPQAGVVIFDSTAPVGQGGPRAVYLRGTAAALDGDALVRGLQVFPGAPERGGRTLTLDDMRPRGPYRLYRFTVAQAAVQCRVGDDPCEPHGLSYAHRVDVEL